jgi:hypothetical protein
MTIVLSNEFLFFSFFGASAQITEEKKRQENKRKATATK